MVYSIPLPATLNLPLQNCSFDQLKITYLGIYLFLTMDSKPNVACCMFKFACMFLTVFSLHR